MGNRIKWVDIYRGLAILLMVVGHTTGLFNPYIYQFHMAAFFFISGYTSRLDEKGLLQTWVTKGYSIYLPYVTFFLFSLFIIWLLHLTGFYPVLFKDPYPGIRFALREFMHHRIHINTLGATWFLITLFGVYVVQRLALLLCSNHAGLGYGLISLTIFIAGYGIIQAPIFVPDRLLDLIFIGQFFFSLGYLASQKNWLAHISTSGRNGLLLLSVSVLLFYLFAHQWPNTVDYPARHFGNVLGNSLAAINGIIFLFLVSSVFERATSTRVVSFVIRMGQNTLGIVFLHFLMFKVSYLLLALVGICDMSCVSAFTPPPDIGRRYWWLISGLSVALSAMTWSLFLRVPSARILMGQDKEILAQFFRNSGNLLVKQDAILEAKLVQVRQVLADIMQLAMERRKATLLPIVAVVALATWPLLVGGVICNDEVQTSYWAQLGWSQFWDHFLHVWTSQGRALGAPLNIVSAYLGFLSTNVLIFRATSIGLMLMVFGLFGWLVARLLRRHVFGFALFVALLLLLPISFEHTLPNAFVTLFSLPLILAFLSFHLFLSYLEKRQRSLLISSSVLWFLFLTGYEAFVVLTPVFFVIAYFERHVSPRNTVRVLVECRHIIATTALFLASYIIARKIFPSAYAGNAIAELNLVKSASIIGHLVASGIPGYYLFNAKYQYLFDLFVNSYQSMGTVLPANPLAVSAGKLLPFGSSTLTNFRNAFVDIRMLAMLIFGVTLAWKVGPCINSGEQTISKVRLPWLLGVPFLMSIIIAVPNSLGKLYQDTVNGIDFIALPVTFMIYGFLMFDFVVIVWFSLERMSKIWARIFLISLIVLLVLPIQAMNGVFAQEQERNFNRFTMLQAVFDTDLLRHLDTATVFSSDFYQTRNLLAIHEGYWSSLAKAKGINMEVSSKDSNQPYELRVLSDKQVAMLGPQQITLLSLERIKDRKFYLIDQVTCVSNATILRSEERDGHFYKYTVQAGETLSSAGELCLQTVLSQNDVQPLLEMKRSAIGDTFNRAQIQTGFFSDGWVAAEASLNIRTGATGMIALTGLLNIPLRNDMAIEIFDNDRKIGQYRVAQEKFQIIVPVNSGGQVAHLKFRANWEFDAVYPDVRKLSYLLVSMDGM